MTTPTHDRVIAASQTLDDEVGMTRDMLDRVEAWRKQHASIPVRIAPRPGREYAFAYDVLPSDDALPTSDTVLVPIEADTDGGIIAWAVDAAHAAAIVAALRAAENAYEAEL